MYRALYRRCEELHVPAGPEGDVPAGTAAPLPGGTGSPTLCSQVGHLVYYRCLLFFNPGSEIHDGSGMNNPDHISESLETILWVKIFKFSDADPDPRSGIFLILDSGRKKFGSGIRYQG